MIRVQKITFEEILPIWSAFLWPNRKSPIETHSAIKYGAMPYEYDIEYFKNPPSFWAALDEEGRIVGVNSGHKTGSSYRSRGLFVMPHSRGQGIATMLLMQTVYQAKLELSKFCWTMPRRSSIKSYNKAGFIQTSDWFGTETSDSNCFALIEL